LNGDGAVTSSLLIITGTMGAGKTTVLGEASDILTSRQISHAAIDLDALGLSHLPPAAANNAVMHRNLQSVCENYTSLGVRRFLLARAIEHRAELDLCRSIVSATNTVVCRLAATLETMQQRVKMRETGISQHEYVARVGILQAILDRAHLEDFTVTSENCSVTEVANQMLLKAGWISELPS
jgi:adenylylsulfate kinase-like enzyme